MNHCRTNKILAIFIVMGVFILGAFGKAKLDNTVVFGDICITYNNVPLISKEDSTYQEYSAKRLTMDYLMAERPNHVKIEIIKIIGAENFIDRYEKRIKEPVEDILMPDVQNETLVYDYTEVAGLHAFRMMYELDGENYGIIEKKGTLTCQTIVFEYKKDVYMINAVAANNDRDLAEVEALIASIELK